MELKQKTIDTLQKETCLLSEFLVDFQEWLKIADAETELQEAFEDVFANSYDGTETLINLLRIKEGKFTVEEVEKVKVELYK